MDDMLFFMDVFPNYIYAEPLRRRFPTPWPVEMLGYIPHKQYWIRRKFHHHSFSFILKGGGEYWLAGKLWPVTAPCVITQPVGIHTEYGPAGAWTEWEEFYVAYNRSVVPALERAGLVRTKAPAWRICDPAATCERLAELLSILAKPERPAFADHLDRACERLIMESILAESDQPPGRKEQAIRNIQAFLKAHYLEDHDLDCLAAQCGMSRSAFRRHWDKQFELPPARYVMSLRLRKACRLLVETDLAIGEIAGKLAFRDTLYFSRIFRKSIGLTASEYRRRHQAPLSLAALPVTME